MKTYLDSEKPEVRIEIVPLIDVVFCILVFFILGAVRLTAPEGIGVDLPQAKTGQPQLEETITVQLKASGALSLNDEPIYAEAKLKQDLKEYLRQQPKGLIVLEADKQARYDLVIRVVDLLRDIGGNRVALETIQPKAETVLPGLPNGLPSLPGTVPALPNPPANTAPGQPTSPGAGARPLPQSPAPGQATPVPGQPLNQLPSGAQNSTP